MLIRKSPESKTFGIAIKNDSCEPYELRFLGSTHIKKYPEGISVSNLFGDVLFDDNKLAYLRSWISGIGSIEISLLRFQSDAHVGSSYIDVIENDRVVLSKHFGMYLDINSHNHRVVSVPFRYIITATTSFKTTIRANTGCAIIFHPAQKQLNRMKGYDELYKDIQVEYGEYSEKKKRKFLFMQ